MSGKLNTLGSIVSRTHGKASQLYVREELGGMGKGLSGLLLTNRDSIEGVKVQEELGLVCGNIARSRDIFRDVFSEIQQVFGGELHMYSTMLKDTREIATIRMGEEAAEMGADAVLNVRMETNVIARNSAEVLVYGTAVKLEGGEREEQ
eukprot:TRINITY_DN7330_c0_g1_i1.p2 TRINITY_DN7330_c0_g1~~TRINITY_DN7330_c0_g1_i1.p2  ORF type:complete len:149 (-),score=40.79 TRINITY_DN7330_c0_g1_i1:30-476(-)